MPEVVKRQTRQEQGEQRKSGKRKNGKEEMGKQRKTSGKREKRVEREKDEWNEALIDISCFFEINARA